VRVPALALLVAAGPASAGEPLRTDLHVHFTMREAFKPLFHGESGRGRMASSPSGIFRNQVDTDQLLAAGVRVAVASVWPPPAVRPGLTARDEAIHQIEGLREFAVHHPEVHLATSAADARAALARGQIALIPAVEGGEGVLSPDDIDLYYARGVRLMTVIHMMDSALGGAAAGQLTLMLGMTPGGGNPQRLTELGHAVVRRMVEVGMAIDVAHSSDATAQDILEVAKSEHVPVLFTHAGARALHPMERNLTDEMAQQVARTGGIIGVTLFRDFVADVPEAARWKGFEEGTCDEVVAHWKHFVDRVGPDAVVLGSDWNGMVTRSKPGGACPNGLRTTADLPSLYTALAAQGIPQKSLDLGGERLLQVLERVEARADPWAQRRARARRDGAVNAFDVAL
jgi:membrane dipeptidase